MGIRNYMLHRFIIISKMVHIRRHGHYSDINLPINMTDYKRPTIDFNKDSSYDIHMNGLIEYKPATDSMALQAASPSSLVILQVYSPLSNPLMSSISRTACLSILSIRYLPSSWISSDPKNQETLGVGKPSTLHFNAIDFPTSAVTSSNLSMNRGGAVKEI